MISPQDVVRSQARQYARIKQAELEERRGNFQKAADLFGEAADAAIGQACVDLAQKQMQNFFRASSAPRHMMAQGMRTLKAS